MSPGENEFDTLPYKDIRPTGLGPALTTSSQLIKPAKTLFPKEVTFK